MDPEGDLQEKKEEPTLFDIVLRPEKFITTSAEEREAEDDPAYENPNDFNQFRYEFSTTTSTTTTTDTTTSEQRCLKRGHVANETFHTLPNLPLFLSQWAIFSKGTPSPVGHVTFF